MSSKDIPKFIKLVPALYCNRCKSVWVSNKMAKDYQQIIVKAANKALSQKDIRFILANLPKVCPRCKSGYWNKGRVR